MGLVSNSKSIKGHRHFLHNVWTSYESRGLGLWVKNVDRSLLNVLLVLFCFVLVCFAFVYFYCFVGVPSLHPHRQVRMPEDYTNMSTMKSHLSCTVYGRLM